MREGKCMIVKRSHESFTSKKLAGFKKFALRRRVWFKSLSRIERGIIDLTIKYVDNIKSTKLVKVLTAIIEKLQISMESKAERLVRTIGLALAKKISEIAVKWGNGLAIAWAKDREFARFLVFNFSKVGGS
jgi:hypothetical protein